jgi:cellobiose transport system substrate-binding protein
MVYRTDLFEQSGLPTDREEVAKLISTWDDFVEVGKKVKAATGQAMLDKVNTFYRMVLSQAEEQYFDRATGKLIIETNPSVREAWDDAAELAELGLSANLKLWKPEWGSGIAGGDFAVMLTPSWMLNDIKSNAPHAEGKWDITSLPGGGGNWGGSFLTLPKEGDHPREAYELIKWLTDPQQQLTVYKDRSNFPSAPDIYDDPAIQNKRDPYFGDTPIGEIYSQLARKVRPVYEGPRQHIINTIIESALDKVEDKEATPEEAWNEAMDLIKRQFNLFESTRVK